MKRLWCVSVLLLMHLLTSSALADSRPLWPNAYAAYVYWGNAFGCEINEDIDHSNFDAETKFGIVEDAMYRYNKDTFIVHSAIIHVASLGEKAKEHDLLRVYGFIASLEFEPPSSFTKKSVRDRLDELELIFNEILDAVNMDDLLAGEHVLCYKGGNYEFYLKYYDDSSEIRLIAV